MSAGAAILMSFPTSSNLAWDGSYEFGDPPALFQNVALAPLHNVDSEHLFVNQAGPEVQSLIRMGQLGLEALQQLFPDFMRNAAGVRGIDIVIQQQMPEEQLPVFAEQVQQSLPVYAASCAVNDVANVSCVESFAARDKDLRGNELFRSQDPCRDPKDFQAARPLNPAANDSTQLTFATSFTAH